MAWRAPIGNRALRATLNVTIQSDPLPAVLPACREFSEHICSPNVRAEDALESALAMYVAAKGPLPTSSEAEADEVIVPFSTLGMAKTALYQAMRE